MKTSERITALAQAAKAFPFLGSIEETDLRCLLVDELGHAEVIDSFQPLQGRLIRAVPCSPVYHLVSGNTPHAALQSLIRGLLVGAENYLKMPRTDLPEVTQFLALLPSELSSRVQLDRAFRLDWLEASEAVVVYGQDETLQTIQRHIQPHQRFIKHGHKISIGVFFEMPPPEVLHHAARDICQFDQKGCLSPQIFYVAEHDNCTVKSLAERLQPALRAISSAFPRHTLTLSEANSLLEAKETLRFRSIVGEPVHLLPEQPGDDFTIICDRRREIVFSPLNRCIFVKPWTQELEKSGHSLRRYAAAAAIFPSSVAHATKLNHLAPSRICAFGSMQWPPISWHQEGIKNCAALIKFIDFEN